MPFNLQKILVCNDFMLSVFQSPQCSEGCSIKFACLHEQGLYFVNHLQRFLKKFWYVNVFTNEVPKLGVCRDGSCVLFDQEEIDQWEARFQLEQQQYQQPGVNRVAGLLGGHVGLRPCPNCRQPNWKVGLNLGPFCCYSKSIYYCLATF